jgi:hypothetical protein
MANARGTLVLNSIAFIRERFGPEAHDKVLAALPRQHAGTFLGPLYEGAWKPLEDLLAYMETARKVLAPRKAHFYQSMGEFAGERDRKSTAFSIMLADFDTAARMAPLLWRSFFDAGRLEVIEKHASGATLRVYDGPASAALCERVTGSLAGQTGDPTVRVEQVACRVDGRPYCEFQMRWGDARHKNRPAPRRG